MLLVGCGPARQPVPAGIIPLIKPLSVEDEQYGHEVLSQLTEQFPLEQDDSKIERARRIVDRLTTAAKADQQPWHVYVLHAPAVKNAAATRGNHIFVWSGMLDSLPDDNELSVVIAHEISHVLAEHAHLTPNEEASQILSQVAGAVAQHTMVYRGNVGIVADLAAAITQETIGAFLINPEAQRKELEADLIGIHLMAEARIDPRMALAFWQKNLNNPDYGSALPQFLSSHPSSKERLKNIEANLSGAIRRYERATGKIAADINPRQNEWVVPKSEGRSVGRSSPPSGDGHLNLSSMSPGKPAINTNANGEPWLVVENRAIVHQAPSRQSAQVRILNRGERLRVLGRGGSRGWLRVVWPVEGYVWGPFLSPVQ